MKLSLGPDLSVTQDGRWLGQLPDLVAARKAIVPAKATPSEKVRIESQRALANVVVPQVTVEHARERARLSPELVPALKSFFPDLIPPPKKTEAKPAPSVAAVEPKA